ncbi:MAG: hypothetical protein Q8J70_07255, partial [Thiobacillus sp.]|nr:hypothetical protein [Thiobacillus sp.]
AVMPAVRPNSLCQAMTGGGGSLLMVRPPFAPPQSSFVDLGSDLGYSAPPGANTAQPFPAGVTVFGMTFPWVSGQVANGVTTSDGGGQKASFTVDVTDRLNGAFNRGDAVIAFMLSGSDETLPTVSPPDRFDCRTVYRIGQLVIKHL